MKVLIVGAGAVGLVYGYHLQRAGVDVHFYLREKYVDEAKAGYTLYPLNRKNRSEPVLFKNFGVCSTPEHVAEQTWDQVWLAVSSTAIRLPWLETLIQAVGDTATVVSLQPGRTDRAVLLEQVSAERLVTGVIAMISYQAPLNGETRFPSPGMAYWFPPGPTDFAGDKSRTAAVVGPLKAGGCPAATVDSIEKQAGFGSALLNVHIAALDGAGWGWSDTRNGDWLTLASEAWRQAAAIVAHDLDTKTPWWTGLVRPFTARWVMRLAPWLIPLDLETYLAYHFTKVGDQTRLHLEYASDRGAALGLPNSALSTLRSRMN